MVSLSSVVSAVFFLIPPEIYTILLCSTGRLLSTFKVLRREKNMRSRARTLSRFLFVGISSSILAAGCASFPGKELPTYTYENMTAPAAKLTVSYDVRALALGRDSAGAAKVMQEEIEKVLKASPLFAQVVPGAGTGEYQYSFITRFSARPELRSSRYVTGAMKTFPGLS